MTVQTARSDTMNRSQRLQPAMMWLSCLLAILVIANQAPCADETPPLRLGSVRVEPTGGQEEVLVRRHLPLHVGQEVNLEILLQSRTYLQETGLFENVDVYTVRGTVIGEVVLVVEASLDRRVRLETGLGHEPLNGWFLNLVGLRMSSPFGRGGEFRAGFRQGQRSTGLYSSLFIPSLMNSETDLLLEFGHHVESWVIHHEQLAYTQDINRRHFRAGLRRRTLGSLEMILWGGTSMARPDSRLEGAEDEDDRPATDILSEPEKHHYFDLIFEALWDRRDRLRPWQAGSWAAVRVKTSSRDDGSPFWGVETDARIAKPVAGTRAVALHFHTALLDQDTPYHLREIFGGCRSMRGFASAGLSGPYGARALYFFNAEWRQPLAGDDPRRPGVLGTFFMDLGDHWNASGARHGLSADVGYGVQFTLPWLQVINFEVAYPLTAEETGHAVMVHVSLGRSF